MLRKSGKLSHDKRIMTGNKNKTKPKRSI